MWNTRQRALTTILLATLEGEKRREEEERRRGRREKSANRGLSHLAAPHPLPGLDVHLTCARFRFRFDCFPFFAVVLPGQQRDIAQRSVRQRSLDTRSAQLSSAAAKRDATPQASRSVLRRHARHSVKSISVRCWCVRLTAEVEIRDRPSRFALMTGLAVAVRLRSAQSQRDEMVVVAVLSASTRCSSRSGCRDLLCESLQMLHV